MIKMLPQKKVWDVFVFSHGSGTFFSDASDLWASYCLSYTSSYTGFNRTVNVLYCWL